MSSPFRHLAILATTALLAASTTACTSGVGDPPPPLPGSGTVSTGQEYPEGPYGNTVGNVINNFVFPGYTRPGRGLGDTMRGDVALGDFYNPTGEGIFPDDSPYDPGAKMPRALIINVSAVWCGPCKFEAQNVLPGEYEHFQPLGAELMLVLADSVDPGDPADFPNLDNWVSSFEATYPSVIDPDYQMGTLFDTSQFPANFIIDTRDMTILEFVAGIPQDGFWDQVTILLEESAPQ